MNNRLVKMIERLNADAQTKNLHLINQKELTYGMQLEYLFLEEKSKINIYYSEKKDRISFVLSPNKGKINFILQEIINKINTGQTEDNLEMLHNWTSWIGSDESGKGDYFGPLVVAAFYCQEKDKAILHSMGVKDSKLLTDDEINIIARKIGQRFPEQYKIITLVPQKYNELYSNFKKSKKNLNHLLAWCHAKVIADLANKYNPQGIFVDRFTQQGLVEYYLNSEKIDNCDVLQAHKGERDIAVAAASILARAKFNAGIEYYSKQFSLKIPKGGGKQTIVLGKKFIEKYGEDALEQIAKLHFINTQKILD